MPGVMAPPERHSSQPLMLAAAAPLHPPRGLMTADVEAFAEFDLPVELRRFLWGAAGLLALVIYLAHAAR
jgi:hypothetical protein